MRFINTPLDGAYVIEHSPFTDERGVFTRMFCQKELAEIGFRKHIVQINHSLTREKGSIRGMHFQTNPSCEVKIISCIRGKVFDVMVDIRKGSATFLKWHGITLAIESSLAVYIPEGFAHGFQALSDDVELLYFHSSFYDREYERGLRFDDPVLAIEWPLPKGTVSAKDLSYPLLHTDFKGIDL